MATATLEEQKALGLTTPPEGVPDIPPKTKVVSLGVVDHKSYRRLVPWDDAKMAKIKAVMKDVCRESKENTRQQNNKIRRAIDRLEGISAPKDYPWPDSSNLNIPYTEIQILVAADIVGATVLDSDPVYFCKEIIPSREGMEEHVDPRVEGFLNWVFRKQLNLDEDTRMAIFLAFRDPLSLMVMDWVVEEGKEYSVQVFDDVQKFREKFPTAEAAGVPDSTYEQWLGQIGIGHESLELEICELVTRYRGPKSRVVELKDFVRYPVSCPDLNYAQFVGDQSRERKAFFLKKVKYEHYYKKETEEMLTKNAKNEAIDDISSRLDTIEGITSSNRRNPDEFDFVRGNLKIDLDNDGEEEMYHVVYNADHDKLLRLERYPYWHNRSNYIPFRIRRKPNRLLGRCFVDMLYDINEEINTQHNQRIDSRTITTVPSFKIHATETDLLEVMTRNDQKFYPGCRFVVSNMNNLQQFETKVDFSGTLQEEQNLMQIGDMLTGTGSSGARSSTSGGKDPRASGKKLQAQIGQSNQRIDGYIREVRPALNEVGSQALELYYQFSRGTVIQYSSYDETTDGWVRNEIERVKLRNRNMTVEIARTSVLDSPDALLQRALTDYEIWSKEPLVGMNLKRRWELIRSTMFAEKKTNIPKLLPPMKQLLQEMQEQDGLQNGSPSHQGLLEAAQEKAGKPKRNEPTGKRQGSKDLRPSQLDRSQKGHP